MVVFHKIPANKRSPGYFAEIDDSKAGTGVLDQPMALFGIGLSTGTASPDILIPISSFDEAKKKFGAGSMAAAMVKSALYGNSSTELLVCPVSENSSGVQATGFIKIDSAATASGTFVFYIAAERIEVGVALGDTVDTIAANLQAAIDANEDVVVTSAVATDTVTLTCRWKGTSGNDINLAVNYYDSDQLPEGVTVTITAMNGGSGDFDMGDAIANIGDQALEYIGVGALDALTCDQIEGSTGLLSESESGGRWSYQTTLFGQAFAAGVGNQSEHQTFAATRNDAHISRLSLEKGTYSAPWEVAAIYTAIAGRSLLNHPAKSMHILDLPGVLPAPKHMRFLEQQREGLLYNGCATQYVGKDGVMRIHRPITLYQVNEYGTADNAWLDINTSATLAYVIRALIYRCQQEFSNAIAVDDTARVNPGIPAVDSQTVKSVLVSELRMLEGGAYVEQVDIAIKTMIVNRNSIEPGRFDVHMEPDITNPLYIIAMLVQYRLQHKGF